MNVYLDHNATAPLRPAAREAMVAAMDLVGNASSVHGHGRAARQLLEAARRDVAALVGAPAAQVIFTSGATEANNLALAAAGGGPVAVSAVEHESIIGAGQDFAVLAVDGDGVVDGDAMERTLATAAPALVSVMAANNETGVVQPIGELAARAKATGALFHSDMVQVAGKRDILDTAGIDLISLSAHKIGGPAGIGALINLGDVDLTPVLRGGGQERGRRAGTENLVGIAGFAAAARAAMLGRDDFARLAQLRDRFEDDILAAIPDIYIAGQGRPRLVNTACLALPGVTASTLVMSLDLAGFSVSAGAACSSGKVERSHVLAAMAAPAWAAAGAVRISLGWNTVAADFDGLVEACVRLYKRAA